MLQMEDSQKSCTDEIWGANVLGLDSNIDWPTAPMNKHWVTMKRKNSSIS